jgi:Zn-dependent protease
MREVDSSAVVCACGALVHADELARIAEEARELERHGDLAAARERWLTALPLLPGKANQAEWIREHADALEAALEPDEAQSQQARSDWAKKLGPLAPVAVLLAKGKGLLALFKLQFLLSLVAFLGVYWAVWGMKFGLGFAALVFVHEMGHFIDVRRRGLPADMPVFLPGLGAYVRWRALGVTQTTRAAISLAGPLAGLLAATVCYAAWAATGNGLWAALARASAWLNVLNLIPVWVLDGAQAVTVLSKLQRVIVVTVCVALWAALGEGIFFLVALGCGWRLLTHDLSSEPNPRMTAYFVALLVCFAVVMRLVPGHGAGLP